MGAVGQQGKNLSAGRAVLVGHLWVNVPVLLIIGLGSGAGAMLGYSRAGALVGTVPAWIFWSFTVPRWRRWAMACGAPPEETQRLASATGLTWPKGFVLQKTEARLDGDERR
jgi:hypothetical protein